MSRTYLSIDKYFMDESAYSPKATEILDAAERAMRRGGYDGVSYRDLAAEVGIKSASVHYHFPQKPDLGRAVVERYGERFLAVLGAPDDPAEIPKDRLARLAGAYETSLKASHSACLCCVLGAEAKDLPDPVSEAVRDFFKQLLAWATTAFDGHKDFAGHAIGALQGAMVLAVSLDRPAFIEEAAAELRETL